MAKQYPPKGELCKHFRYDKETGKLYRKFKTKEKEVGNINSKGYLIIGFKNIDYLVHRIIWVMAYGTIDNNLEIDHIDGNGLNNKLNNLRLVIHKENLKNQKQRKDNTSGFRGICWHKQREKWYAQIMVNRKNIYLGYFEDFNEAKKARLKAEKKYRFHKNHGRVNDELEK